MFGMPVEQMLRSVSSRELTEWRAYFNLLDHEEEQRRKDKVTGRLGRRQQQQ